MLFRRCTHNVPARPAWAYLPFWVMRITAFTLFVLFIAPAYTRSVVSPGVMTLVGLLTAVGAFIFIAGIGHKVWRVRRAQELVNDDGAYFKQTLEQHSPQFSAYLFATGKASAWFAGRFNVLDHDAKVEVALAFMSYLVSTDKRWWSWAGMRNRVVQTQVFQLVVAPPLLRVLKRRQYRILAYLMYANKSPLVNERR